MILKPKSEEKLDLNLFFTSILSDCKIPSDGMATVNIYLPRIDFNVKDSKCDVSLMRSSSSREIDIERD